MKKIPNEDLGRISVEEFQSTTKNPIVVVLDNVRSMQNVGSVFRSCDAFLIEKMYLCGISPKPPHRDISKTALGATESVDWEYVSNTKDAIQQLKEQDYFIYAIEQVEQALPLQDLVWDGAQKVAVVLGHEVNGVAQEIVNQCNRAIEIPQFGSKHSLNVSVSAGIVLWQFIAQNC